MLDQYRQDLHQDNDHLGQRGFQMSRRKMVFTLAGAALALLFFLFLIGAFRTEDEVTSEKETTAAVSSELIDLQARVEKLEQRVLGQSFMAQAAPTPQETNNGPLTDNALKQLIAANSGIDPAPQEPMVYDNSQSAEPQVQVPETVQPTPAKPQARNYVIQKGDTLSKISQKFYGTTKKWKVIYDANRERISNTNQLKVGTQITIPDDASK